MSHCPIKTHYGSGSRLTILLRGTADILSDGRGLSRRIRKSACTFSVSRGSGVTRLTDGGGRCSACSSQRMMSYCNTATVRRTTTRFIRAFGLPRHHATPSRHDGCFTSSGQRFPAGACVFIWDGNCRVRASTAFSMPIIRHLSCRTTRRCLCAASTRGGKLNELHNARASYQHHFRACCVWRTRSRRKPRMVMMLWARQMQSTLQPTRFTYNEGPCIIPVIKCR